MRARPPHWSSWLVGLAAAGLAVSGLVLQQQRLPTAPPGVGSTVPLTIRARAPFVLPSPRPAPDAKAKGGAPAAKAKGSAPDAKAAGSAPAAKAKGSAPDAKAKGSAPDAKAAGSAPDAKAKGGESDGEQDDGAPSASSPPMPAARGGTLHVARDRVLLTAGETVSAAHRRLIAAAWQADPPPDLRSLIVRVVIVVGVFGLLLWLGAGGRSRPPRRLSLLLLLPALAAASTHLLSLLTPLPLGCAPLALAGLLAGLVLGRRDAVLVAGVAVLLIFVLEVTRGAALIGLATGCAVAALLVSPRRTFSVLPAALAGGVVQAGVLLAVAPVAPPFGSDPQGYELLLGGAGVLGAGLLALLLARPVQAWSGVVSAGRLKRITAPTSVVMRELRRRTPGTYRHARNVAHLAEVGGRALGGDLLLLRAGAWVHDLGKLLAPELFVENQRPGDDPQAALTPEQSALRIRRHVADGLRVARRYRVPGELRALIAEHHGTSGVHGPLQRARREGRDIDPAVYYYAGPLPQTREAAILMVSDAVEAASRRLDETSLAAVSALVEEVVQRLMSEYQFEDCDVTQVELVALQEALALDLRHALHRRSPPPRDDETSP